MFSFILNHFYWFWLAVMVACIVIEALTMALTTVWAAISAFLMIFLCQAKFPIRWQIIIFLVITILLVVFTRPFAIKKLKLGKNTTNVNSMAGQEVLVIKKIAPFEKGEAKAKNGVVWSAISEDGSEISADEVCIVSAVDGNTLKIKRK